MIRLKNKITKYYRHHSRAITVAVVVIMSGWFIMNGVMQMPVIKANRQETAEVKTKIEEEKNRQAEIDDLTKKANTDEYIERAASEKLGLVKSNATIFYDVSEEN